MTTNNRDIARSMIKRLKAGKARRWSKPVTEMTDSELIHALRMAGVRGKLTDQRLEQIARGVSDE